MKLLSSFEQVMAHAGGQHQAPCARRSGLHHQRQCRQHGLSQLRGRPHSRTAVHSRRRSPVRLPIPSNEQGFQFDEVCGSQEWMSAPDELALSTEGASGMTEAELEPSTWADGSGSWDGGPGSILDGSHDPSSSLPEARHASALSLSIDSGADGISAVEDALSSQDSGAELQAHGFWQSLLTRLTPSWLSPRARGLGLLWLLVALVATNWVLVKDGGGLEPLTFSFCRFSVAAMAFAGFLPDALAEETGTLVPAGLELGLWTSLGYLTQAAGLSSTDASRASFISTFTVLAVPFLAGSRLGDGRHIKPVVWVSAVGAIVGVSFLEQGGGTPPGIGDLWSLLSAIFFGVQIYRTEKLSRKLPPNCTFQLMSISLSVVAAASFLCVVAAHPGQALNLLSDPVAAVSAIHGRDIPWQQILWTGLLSTDLALLIELSALNTVSSIDASIIYTAEPVLGAALAFVVLGERWGPTGWIGAGLIIASSLAAQISGADDTDTSAEVEP